MGQNGHGWVGNGARQVKYGTMWQPDIQLPIEIGAGNPRVSPRLPVPVPQQTRVWSGVLTGFDGF